MAKKGIYPAAVYLAYFADGSTLRMAFWSQYGKPINYEAGAKTCAMAAWENPSLYGSRFTSRKPEAKAAIDRAEYEKAAVEGYFGPRKPDNWIGGDCYGSSAIVDGYVLQRGEDGEYTVTGRDPRFVGEAKHACPYMPDIRPRKETLKIATVKALLARVLEGDEEAISEARRIVA